MAYGRKNKKRNRYGKKGNFGKKSTRKMAKAVINVTRPKMLSNIPSAMRNNLPMPPRFRTTLKSNIIGHINAGSILAAAGGLKLLVKGNCPDRPFGDPSFTGNFTITPTSGTPTSLTLKAAGFSQFMPSAGVNGFYQYCRVLASSIKIKANPFLASEEVWICCVPEVQTPVPAQIYTSLLTASEGPYSSGVRFINYYTGIKDQIIKNYCSTARLFGVPVQAVYDEDDYQHPYNANPANYWSWDIFFKLQSDVVNTGILPIAIEVKYYVEFCMTTAAGLPDI